MSLADLAAGALLKGVKAFIKQKLPNLPEAEIEAGISEALQKLGARKNSGDMGDLLRVKKSLGLRDGALKSALPHLGAALRNTPLGSIPGLSGFLAQAGNSLLQAGNGEELPKPGGQQQRWKSLPALKHKRGAS